MNGIVRILSLFAAIGLLALAALGQTFAPGVTLVPVAMGYGFENINSQSFSRHTIYTVGATQYIAFYGVNTNVTLGCRVLGTTNWVFSATSFLPNDAADGHDVVSMGISGDAVIHVSWGMHGNPFHYARTPPGSLVLTATNMTGFESGVTYPQFINCPNGDLLFVFREGGSGAGNTYINHYSSMTHAWTNVTLGSSQAPFIVGATGNSATQCNAYPNYECLDSNTNLQMTWIWRDSAVSIDFNHDTIYARSPDYGATWQTWNGTPYTLPITETNADNIWPIPTNHTIMNQSGQCLDTNNRPVICNWWAPLGVGTPIQYGIIWNDGAQWRTNQIGNRITSEAQTWPTRPLIVCDTNNWLWVVFTDPERGSVPTLAWTSDTNRAIWHFADLTSEFMGDRAIDTWGGWEATHDPVVWQRNGKLDLFYQPITHVLTGTPVSVLEFDPAVFLSSLPPPQVTFEWAGASGNGLWSQGINWTNEVSPASGGGINVALSFPGTNLYCASNDLPNVFDLNSLLLNGFTAGTNQLQGNPLAFISGLTQPALNQSGIASVIIGNPLVLSNSLVVSLGGTGVVECDGIISGPGGMMISGGGSLILTNTNSFAGSLNISSGTLLFGNGSLGSGDIVFGGCTLGWLPGTDYDFSAARATTLSGSLTVINMHGRDETLAGNIAGSGGLSIADVAGGSLTLAGSNSYGGATSVNAGRLIAANSSAVGATGSTTSIAGNNATCSLGLEGGIQLANPIQLGGRSPLPNASGAAAHVVNLAGTNTIIGSITTTTGGNQYNIECDAGLLVMAGNYAQVSGSGVRYLNLQGAGDAIWSGNINDGTAQATVTIRGTGRWTLAGTNGYSGPTLVTSGTLALSGSGSVLGSPSITIASNAFFDVSGLNSTLTLSSAQALIGTGPNASGTINCGSNTGLTMGGTSSLQMTFCPGVPPFVVTGGVFTLGANNLVTVTIANGGVPLGVSTNKLVSSAVGGALAGAVPTSLSVAGDGIAAGAAASLQLKSGELDLVVAAIATNPAPSLSWKGGNPNNVWDNNTANFWNGSNFLAFSNSDNVNFNSLGSGEAAVNINAVVSPGMVLVDTSVNNYSFSGSGRISGGATLIKTNTGTLIVATSNDYSGNTIVVGGVLQLGDGTANLGLPGGGNITDNAVITFANYTNQTCAGNIGGSGSLAKTGAGILALSGVNTYSGGTTINSGGGIVRIDSATALPAAGIVTISKAGQNTGTLQLNAGGGNRFSNGFGSFFSANGLLNGGTAHIDNLQGTNTIAGNLMIANAGGNGVDIQSDGGLLVFSGTLENTVSSSSRAFDFGGAGNSAVTGSVVNGSGTALTYLVKDGPGTLSITGTSNSFTGGVVINGGTLNAASLSDSGANSSLGSGGNITFSGGTLQYTNTAAQSINRTNLIYPTGGTLDASGSGGGAVMFTGVFTNVDAPGILLSFGNGSSLATNNPANTPGLVVGMTLAASGLPVGTTITAINGNVLSLNNKYTGTGGAVASTFGIFNRTFTLTGANTGSNTIYSALGNSTGGGALGIAKSGSGSWILAGTNTYTGPTTVSNGTLLVNGSLALASVVTVFGGTLGGTGIIGGSVAVHANASLSPGNPLGALTINGNLTLAADSMTRIVVVHSPLTNNSTHISGVLTEAGSLIVTNIGGTALAAGDSFKLFSAASYNGAFDSMNLPPLSAGLGWNTDFLNSNGTLSVVVASSPMLGSVSISGGSLVFKGSGGVTGAHFYLLGSTNLSAPPSQWTRLLTNQFDTSGNFSFTWPLSSNTPQFYLLEVP